MGKPGPVPPRRQLVLNDTCENDISVDCTAGGDAVCAGVGGSCGDAGYRDSKIPDAKQLQSDAAPARVRAVRAEEEDIPLP